MKKCFKCGIEKPLSDFYKHAMMGDGHLNKCKTCTKNDVSKHRLENIEAIRAYDKERASLPHRKALKDAVMARWYANHPERKRAATTVARAIRRGILVRWPCEICGEQKSEAHHTDYSKPLLVTWLCRPHHMQAHALARRSDVPEDANLSQ